MSETDRYYLSLIMTEEIFKNIFRIHVPLTGNPLKELNSYFIKSEGEQLLIDTGFRREDCWTALTAALEELGADYDKLSLVITHVHSDHCGNANLIAKNNNKVYMGKPDVSYSYLRSQGLDKYGHSMMQEGFLPEWIEIQEKNNASYMEWMNDPFALNLIPMETGDKIKCGEYEFEWVLTPGHSPGNSMLYERDHKIMFTGDHILFDITPNITNWPGMDDALGDYLDSLRLAQTYDVEYAFPGHRDYDGYDYYKRIEELLEHHQRRLMQSYSIVCENPGLNATAICSLMTWKIRCKNWDDFPQIQRFFAVGETIAHLDYLRIRGKVRKEMGEDGNYIYYQAEEDK